MDYVEQRRVRRLTVISTLISIENCLNIYLAYLSFLTQSQLYFNLIMITALIDRVLSVVVVAIKNSYLQSWILDALNLPFLIRYSNFYLSEHQSMMTYAAYIKVLPLLVVQLIYFYVSNSVFDSIEGDFAQVLMIAFQLNILNIFFVVKGLFMNSQEFNQGQQGAEAIESIKKQGMFVDRWMNLLNVYCFYNMWAIILTSQQSSSITYNMSLWCIIFYVLFLVIELKQTKHLKSTIYALSCFELKLDDLKDLQFYEIMVRKYHTIRFYAQLFFFIIISIASYVIVNKEEQQYYNQNLASLIYQDTIKTITTLNCIFSIFNIIKICREIKVDLNSENKNLSRVIQLVLNDNKSSHFIILTSLSIFYDYFEVDSTLLYDTKEESNKIAEIDKFYFFSKIFELLKNRNGSILIQSLLKTQNGKEVVIIDKHFKLDEKLQLSLLCNSQFLPNQGVVDIELNKENTNKIVSERFSQGILFEETMQQRLNEKQKDVFTAQNNVLLVSLLQVNAFSKQLNTLVMNHPSQVLYDLYEL